MAYREIAPPAALASHVACLWWRDGVASRVLPDGCADLVWTGVDLVVAGGLGISEGRLRRRFQSAAGYPPRTVARVLRLQRFLSLAERDGRDLARLAADAGYADQPHLTRDCTRLTGLPAAALLATGAG